MANPQPTYVQTRERTGNGGTRRSHPTIRKTQTKQPGQQDTQCSQPEHPKPLHNTRRLGNHGPKLKAVAHCAQRSQT
ncbi:hypothetical protein PCASD_17891 [Puccinia coronata f. sp. avenae]|uniref:Uncharacterized protein n=1 Tax=Puccinia coronata f. sp. avenae TaxID=200324 RepID=A0A2N5U932_9BASI|nr:hypothetical protein PCASD_17891 [Puccinia coronata f. sp. avenae]